MQRDWLLGFPPVLLAQDAPVRQQFVTPPRPPACVDARSGAVIDKAETAALDKSSAYDEGTFTVASAPVGPEFATAGQPACTADTVSLAGTVATDPQPGASPISAPGVWRKTAEHKPPVGSEHLTRYTGRGCEKAPDVRPPVWNGEVWLQGAAKIGSCALRDWLDTSGEFKVGDRVRVKDGVVSEFCKPGMVGVVVKGWSDGALWFRADGAEHDFCATNWLEHA